MNKQIIKKIKKQFIDLLHKNILKTQNNSQFRLYLFSYNFFTFSLLNDQNQPGMFHFHADRPTSQPKNLDTYHDRHFGRIYRAHSLHPLILCNGKSQHNKLKINFKNLCCSRKLRKRRQDQ